MKRIVPHQPEVIVIPPRQKQKPLTVKLKEGIEVYARAKGYDPINRTVDVRVVITATLAAYRMDNEELFSWLEKNRYRWDSTRQQWKDLRQG